MEIFHRFLKSIRSKNRVRAERYTALLIVSIFVSQLAYASSADELMCDTKIQSTTKEAPWKCPSLPNLPTEIEVITELSDIDFGTAAYACTYRYKQGGKIAAGCSYVSSFVKDETKKGIKNIVGSLGISNGKIDNLGSIDIDADFNFLSVSPPALVSSVLQPKVNAAVTALKKAKLEARTNKDVSDFNSLVKRIQQESYDMLVKPYVTTSASNPKKDNTMSLFLAGLITLDDSVVKGYNENTGELDFTLGWRAAAGASRPMAATIASTAGGIAGSVVDTVLGWFGGSTHYETEWGPDSDLNYEITSWMDIFKIKIWGYYYNYQRRMDIAYDVISTQLLFIMFLWFAGTAGTRAGIGYHLSYQENGGEGSRMTEEKFMHLLSIILTVGIFFFSVPSTISSTNSVTSASDIPKEMKKNRTLAKAAIRYTAKMGSKIATMGSDLGLDAFLTFVIKSQNLATGSEVRHAYGESLLSMLYYYPALQVIEECKTYYGAGIGDLEESFRDHSYYYNKGYSSRFFSNNKIDMIGLETCKSAGGVSRLIPYEIVKSSLETEKRIDNNNVRMGKAVNLLVRNHIILQDKFGWVSTFLVPVTYFMMKHNDMFFDQGIDSDGIKDSAENYMEALGIKDGSSINFSDAKGLGDKVDLLWAKTSDNVGYASAYVASWIGGAMMLNILPGYEGLFRSTKDYIDNIIHIKEWRKIGAKTKRKGFLLRKLNSLIDTARNTTFGGLGVFRKILDYLRKLANSPFALSTISYILSIVIAYAAWMKGFTIVSISLIAITLIIKTVMYFINLMLHVLASPLVAVWAFTDKQSGGGKIKKFMKDTLVLMLSPFVVVMSAYIFVFMIEFLMMLYTYLMNVLIIDQTATVSLMINGNTSTDAFQSYFTLMLLSTMSGLIIQLFGLILGVYLILNLDKIIFAKLGLSDSDESHLATSVYEKGEHHANPLK